MSQPSSLVKTACPAADTLPQTVRRSVAAVLLALGSGLAATAAPPGTAAVCPQPACDVAPWARPTEDGHSVGYYVGGGSPCRGHYPCAGDGTWGWDYAGFLSVKRVRLYWSNNDRYQGGTGAYKTDGPHLPESCHGHAGEGGSGRD